MTMIIGPRATFGIAFKTTKYGSDIFARLEENHKIEASIIPPIVPIKKPSKVPVEVTRTWIGSDPSAHFSMINVMILEGELNIMICIKKTKRKFRFNDFLYWEK